MNMRFVPTPKPSDKLDDPGRRWFTRSLLATTAMGLAGCGGDVTRVLGTTSTAPKLKLNRLPEGSKAAEWVQLYPEVENEVQRGMAQIIAAENAPDAEPRDSALFKSLVNESTVTIRPAENPQILDQFPEAKQNLLSVLTEGEVGFFLDGYKNHYYLVRKQGESVIAFRQMDVTTGAKGFSNVMDSGGTPLGPIHISSVTLGQMGEVVSHNSTADCKRGELINSQTLGQSGAACIVSAYTAYSNNKRLAERGIGGHGTNVQFDRNGNPRFNLRASGGCVRKSDIDLMAAIAMGWLKKGTKGYIVGPQSNVTAPAAPRAAEPVVVNNPAPQPEAVIAPAPADVTPTQAVPADVAPAPDCAFKPGHPAYGLCG